MTAEPLLAVFKLILPDGSEREIEVRSSPFNIGRIEPNDLVLPHPNVSRSHARLLVEEGQVRLVDLKSSNGTFINGDQLAANEPFLLEPGACFTLGPYTLCLERVLSLEEAPSEAPPVEEPLPAGPPEDLLGPTSDVRSQPPDSSPAGRQPPPPRVPPKNGRDQPPNGRGYDAAFGIPAERSRYLQYLPPLYHDNSFLGRFLLAFEGVLAPIEQMVDNFDVLLDPQTTPGFYLEPLAAWIGLTLDENWPAERQRLLLAEAAELYRRRGTRWALRRHLEIYTGVAPQITEPVKDSDPPHHFKVRLSIPGSQPVDRATVERIIQANKPAHTTYQLDLVKEG